MAKKTPGIYIAIRGDVSAFETDLHKAQQVAKAQGDAIAKSIGNAVSKADLSGGITKLTRELKTAQAALSAGAFKAQVSGLEDIAKAAGVSSKHLESLTNSMLKSQAAATANRAFEYLQKNAGLSTIQLARLRAQLGDTSGALSTLTAGAKAHAVGIFAFGAAAAIAGKQVLDASLEMDRLNKAYATITGSSAAAQNQLDYVYDVTQRLGLQFQGTAEAAKGFFAAGQDSALKEHLNGIFKSVSMAGSALALSKDQMDGVFLALGQMISKGKVQAEELRGQLGERLPGAFDMAARAMGVTTAKLDDMLMKGQVTAEEMLPKLAKVLHDDFAVAAAEASQGLQGQLNRLSTEWTRFQASLLDGDAAAKVIRQLASGMKVLADHGKEIAAIVGKGLQWAAWAAGVYTLIKAVSGLSAAFAALKAVGTAASLATVAAAAVPIALVVGAAAVAFTSLSHSAQSADDIFRKHQATIDAYKEKLGKATEQVKSFSEEQEEAYRKSLERQTKNLKADIADAVADINSELSKIQFLPLDMMFNEKGTLFAQARSEVAELGRELAKLGSRITPQDLDTYKERILAIHDRMVASGLATKEWREMIDALVGEGDSFVLKIAAMIVKGQDLDDALEKLRQTTANAKNELSTGWVLNVDGVSKGIAAMEKSIRGMQAEMLGFKASKALVDLLPDLTPDEIKEAKDAFGKNGLEGALRAVGDATKDWGVAQRLAFNDLLETSNALDDQEKKLDVWRKSQRDSAKDHSSAARYIETIRAEISKLNGDLSASWEQKLDIKLDDIAKKGKDAHLSLDQLRALTKDYASAADAKRVRDLADAFADLDLKIAQAMGDTRKVKGLEIAKQVEEERRKLEALARTPEEKGAISDRLTTYRASLETEIKVENLQVAADFYEKLAALSGDYARSAEYQNQVLAAQAAIYARSLGPEHQKFVDEWERLSRLQNSRDGWDGARRSVLAFYSEATDFGKGFEQATTNMLEGISGAFRITTEGLVVNWNNAMTTMANDFLQIFMRRVVAGIADGGMGWLGGLFGGGSFASSAMGLSGAIPGVGYGSAARNLTGFIPGLHSGGMADEPSFHRAMPLSVFETAPRYHSGHNLPWNPSFEQPAVIRRDESVLTPGQMRTLAGMGGKEAVRPVVNVPLTVEVHYEGRERPTVTRQGSRMDGERMVMELWLSGYENNTLGVRDRMAQG